MGSVDTAGMFQQSAIDEVAAVAMDDIKQAETELELRDKFEEGKVDVATHTDFKIKVERLKSQGIVLAGSKIDHRIDATNEVRAEVVVARRCKLNVKGRRDVCVLEYLSCLISTQLLMIHSMLLSEVDCRREPQREIVVHTQFAEHTDSEAGTVVVNLCIPLLTRLRVNVAIVLQLHILEVHAEQETVMEATLVNIRTVLHLAFLCKRRMKK